MNVECTHNKELVDAIVDIHMNTFAGFFLTFLGKGFLKQLYKGFMEHEKSGMIVAFEEDKLIGFLAYSKELSEFYKYLIKRKLFLFVWYALGAFFRKPKVLFRLLRAFTYSEDSKRTEKYVELSSVGVLPSSKRMGVGSKMIEYLITIVDKDKFDYIKLETDRDNNDQVNSFYVKNGFELERSYETPEGRRMNEYRFYVGAVK